MVRESVVALVLVVSFLLGSIPSGELIGRVFFKKDIRRTGSGNIGTTNAIRALGKAGGYAVFALDFGKGLLAGLFGLWASTALAAGSDAMQDALLFTQGDCLATAFFGSAMGHVFCPWLGFHGGKGIAVSVGCLFVTFGPAGALVELASFILVVAITKYVSAGSLTAALVCPPLALWTFWGDWLAVVLCCAVAVTVVWAHRGNIERLRAGDERRIGHHEEEA